MVHKHSNGENKQNGGQNTTQNGENKKIMDKNYMKTANPREINKTGALKIP